MRLRGAERGPWPRVWAGRPDPGQQQLCAQESQGPSGDTWRDCVFPRRDAVTLLSKCPQESRSADEREGHCKGRRGCYGLSQIRVSCRATGPCACPLHRPRSAVRAAAVGCLLNDCGH